MVGYAKTALASIALILFLNHQFAPAAHITAAMDSISAALSAK